MLDIKVERDDKNLRRLFEAMTEEQRIKAVKSAFRKVANKVKKAAVKNLRTSGLRITPDMEKGIRYGLSKFNVGFYYTIRPKKARGGTYRGVHKNRWGKEKPVLMWAESGTQYRYKKKKFLGIKYGKGQPTGRMRRYGFMSDTAKEVEGSVTADLHETFRKTTLQAAKKYGCT